LQIEDYGLQAMANTSPVKWHLAHTTWFFETFVLLPFCPSYRPFHPAFEHLFNSYYNGVGRPYPRARRGLLSRPTVDEIRRYRSHVDEAMLALLDSETAARVPAVRERTELGCHHEQQHQELLFTDLKYCWFQNPLYPAYGEMVSVRDAKLSPMGWQTVAGGVQEVGHVPGAGFCFDNEAPRHRQYVAEFSIADRLVSNAEYLEFIADGGYERADLWLADGWAALEERRARGAVQAPLYWLRKGDQWLEYTLHGLLPLVASRPVCHLSAYEADAYARWAGCRLPTEFEWEVAAVGQNRERYTDVQAPVGQFLDPAVLQPMAGGGGDAADNILGRVWQWTSSAYSPYPGFSSASGALGEYNGKFMANQLVLRGGSCVTSRDHYRNSYRNFFYPPDQWQFTGIRLARTAVQ
jgi:ergothioneine biosynthesis protein EgtB